MPHDDGSLPGSKALHRSFASAGTCMQLEAETDPKLTSYKFRVPSELHLTDGHRGAQCAAGKPNCCSRFYFKAFA